MRERERERYGILYANSCMKEASLDVLPMQTTYLSEFNLSSRKDYHIAGNFGEGFNLVT